MLDKIYSLYLQHPVICTDSRQIIKNSLFFALKGEKFNGNEFAEIALNNGSAYAIVDEERVVPTKDCRYILVDNVLETLQKLAAFHRTNLNIPIIGITGSNGKTTTKELIKLVLSKKYKTIATTGNLNNHIGVPLTLLSIKKDIEIGIIEMGANHIGEIRQLCNIAKPNYGIITNIGKAHLEGFGSFEGVIKAKKELYDYLLENNGTAFVNIDNELLNKLSLPLKRITYGNNPNAFVKGRLVRPTAEADPFIRIQWGENNFLSTNLIGTHNFENVLSAICIGKYFNVSDKDIQDAISNYVPVNNRSQILKTGRNTLFLDCYNANPTSMNTVIADFVRHWQMNPNKVLILGDMLELGNFSKEEHLLIIEYLKKERTQFNKIILIGDNFFELSGKIEAHHFKTTLEAKQWLLNNPITDATILLKGSRKMQLERLAEVL